MVAGALTLPAGAQTFKVGPGVMADGSLQSRNQTKELSLKKSHKVIAKTIGFGGDNISEVDNLGTLRLVLEEDFSLMPTGSIEEPDRDIDISIHDDDPGYTYPWWNLDPEFTHEPNWGTGYIEPGYAGPAGGCYYMEMVPTEMGGSTQAKINTPLLKLDEDGAIGVIEFKARTLNADEPYDWLLVEIGETNNMGPTWRFPDDPIKVSGIPGEWTTYRLVFRECGPTTLIQLVGVGPGNVYIDDIKVYQLVPHVMYPTTLPHSNYKGSSFTANWEAVANADSYLLSVYSLDEEGNKEFLIEELPTAGTSYNVTNAVSGKIYYYTVKAVKGEYKSIDSKPMRVYALEEPVMSTPEIIDGRHYQASWNSVPGADVYNYMALDRRVAAQDGVFVVTEEDFTDLRDPDGYKTGLTKEDPDEHSLAGYFYPNELNQQGWHGESSMPYDDYMAFDAYFYVTGQGQAGFISPEFDMSKDGGKFKVEADLAAQMDWADNMTSAVVAIFNWDEAAQDYMQVELVRPDKTINEDWQHCSFNLTLGSERTIIGIFAVGSYANLYLDNLKITQNYKAGESLLEPFRFAHWHGRNESDNATSISVEVPHRVSGCDIYHKVSAFSHMPDQYGQSYDARESEYTPLSFVMTSEPSGIEEIQAAALDKDARYFSINGMKVDSSNLVPGIYIVRHGDKVSKVIVD